MTSLEIKEYLEKRGRAAIVFDTVGSTNTFLKENPQKTGTLALALSQSAGHGQYGRVFESPASGLYMSLCVPFIPDFPMTLAAANAVTDTLFELFGHSFGVKWVNDIIFGGKKLCGILAESVFCGDSSFTVVGLGMNLKKGGLSDEVSLVAVSLEEALGRELPSDIIGLLAYKISENLEKELGSAKEQVINKYCERCITEIPENAVFI